MSPLGLVKPSEKTTAIHRLQLQCLPKIFGISCPTPGLLQGAELEEDGLHDHVDAFSQASLPDRHGFTLNRFMINW